MPLRNVPIQRKLMVVMLLTCGAVLLLSSAAFITYEIVNLRKAMVQGLITRAEIIAANSSAALAFDTPDDASEMLASLEADPRIISACIYDANGNIFAKYPTNAPDASFPPAQTYRGYQFGADHLAAFAPVVQRNRTLGSVYLTSDLTAFSQRYLAYSALALLIFMGSFFVAFVISRALQRQISEPILTLANTARAISQNRDYSVRAAKMSTDEFGLFTDAFNHMLAQIQSQNEALSASEARMRAILNSSPNAVVVTDANVSVIGWNPRAEKIFGWSQPEAMGRDLVELVVPPNRRDAQRHELNELLSQRDGDSPQPLEINLSRRAGHEFFGELSVSTVHSGGNVSYCWFISDISERKRLEEVRTRMAAIVESSDDAIISKTLVGVITSWNPGAVKLFGYAPEEVIGKNLLMLFPPDRVEEEKDILARIGRGESVDHFETVRMHKTGRRIDVSVTISPIRDGEGRVIGASKIARDITEGKRAARREAAFARLGQSMSAVASANAAAGIIAEIADELFGWDACSLDVYDAQSDLIYPVLNIDTVNGKRVDVPAAYVGVSPSPIARRVLNEGGQLILREPPFAFSSDAIPFGNTSQPSASLVFAPIHRGDKIIGILSIQSYRPYAYDEQTLKTLQTLADQCGGALERIRAEETVRQLNQELEQRVRDRTAQLEAVNKELEAFSYSVSHDLRAPLRHIDGFAELLRQESGPNLPESSGRYLKTISDASRRMGALIDDLLVFSRMGRSEMRRRHVDMSELLAEVMNEMAEDWRGRVIHWDIGKLPSVNGDRAMLKQVWVNLVSNAVKYTRNRSEAKIEIGGAPNANGEFEFFVRDNGAGFDMEYADKLFGVFQRLHQTEEFEGTGIGLANVRRIILRHGGRTWAYGKVNEGATFYFTLPDTSKPTTHDITETNSPG